MDKDFVTQSPVTKLHFQNDASQKTLGAGSLSLCVYIIIFLLSLYLFIELNHKNDTVINVMESNYLLSDTENRVLNAAD